MDIDTVIKNINNDQEVFNFNLRNASSLKEAISLVVNPNEITEEKITLEGGYEFTVEPSGKSDYFWSLSITEEGNEYSGLCQSLSECYKEIVESWQELK